MLRTTAPCPAGSMCKTMTVSERWPSIPSVPPILPFTPLRLSEPISRMLMALGSTGGCLMPFRSPETSTRPMLSYTERYFA